MTNVDRVKNLHNIALAIAPSLRDKFDFSMDSQFTDWAKISYKAAEALLAETEAKLNAANKADVEAVQRVQIALERDNRLTQTQTVLPPAQLPVNGETK
jgi:hypothetical protein